MTLAFRMYGCRLVDVVENEEFRILDERSRLDGG